MNGHIIICGLGNIGFKTFEILSQAKQKIAVISDITNDEWRWHVEEKGGVFFQGDARNDSLLIEAGIKSAKAILALTDQDMANVSIAMDARNLNANIKIILRMYDTQLGKHLTEACGIHQEFSTSELAAPIFTSRIYQGNALGQFNLDGHIYFVYEEAKPSSPTLLKKGRKSLVAKAIKIHKEKKPLLTTIVNNFLNKFHYFRSPVFANFRRFLLVLACVIFFSALILKWEMSLPFIDALYFVTTTVTTVGYGDFNFSHTSAPLKIFGSILMLFGAAALATLFSSITEILLSRRLPSFLGGRPVPKKNHVIVVGAGHIGHRIVSSLINDRIPTVAIENGEQDLFAEDLKRQIALIDGNPRNNDTLLRANVNRAKAIIVVSDDDILNLSVSLAAKKLNGAIIDIIQIVNSRLANKIETTLTLEKILSVSNIASAYFAAAAFSENILLALEWEKQLVFVSKNPNGPPCKSSRMLVLDNHPFNDVYVSVISLSLSS